jgi:hypothetical protein
MKIRRRLIKFFAKIKYRQFVSACKDPITVQNKVWEKTFHLLNKSSLKKVNPIWEQNPITELKDYLEFFDKQRDTGINKLNNERILFWAQSAGTTGDQKIFPLTESYQKQFQHSIPPFIHLLSDKYESLFDKKSLYLAATDPEEKSSAHIPIGYISNFNYHEMPPMVKQCYVLPDLSLKNGAIFDEYAPLYTLAQDLGSIFAVTPLSIHRFIERIIENWEEHLEKLRQGSVEVNSKRLCYLEGLKPNTLDIKTIWPGIEFICCWKSSICSTQLKNMEALIKDIDLVDAIYSATEGWVNVPMPDYEFGGPVHPGVHNIEFIEMGKEIDSKNLLKIWEIEVGKEYEIFITNMMGLVRYRLKDIVKCTGHFHRSPIIHFVRKEGAAISLGLVTIAENELVEISQSIGLDLGPYQFFAPNELGTSLCYFTLKEASDTTHKLGLLNERLRAINTNFRKYNQSGATPDISLAKLKKVKDLDWHAQRKPKYLFLTYPEKLIDAL